MQIIKKKPAPKNPSDPTYSYENQCYVAAEFDHPYPCTKILWSPDVSSGARDLLATSGDYLRLWSMSDDGLGAGTLTAKREALLNNVSVAVDKSSVYYFLRRKTTGMYSNI